MRSLPTNLSLDATAACPVAHRCAYRDTRPLHALAAAVVDITDLLLTTRALAADVHAELVAARRSLYPCADISGRRLGDGTAGGER